MPIRRIKNPYNFSLCRTCEHHYISHETILAENQFCRWNFTKACKCKEFLPKDNLEFLAHMYAKIK